MKNNFLIISLGRSGSKFLWTAMNRSKCFEVVHDNYAETEIYEKGNYGEINGMSLDSGYKTIKEWKGRSGIILRNPVDVCLSKYNRCLEKFGESGVTQFEKILNPTVELSQYIPQQGHTFLKYDLVLIDQLLSNGCTPIFFDKMTSSLPYLMEVLSNFGINDVEESQLPRKKINQWKKIETSFPPHIDNKVHQQSEWFINKYNL